MSQVTDRPSSTLQPPICNSAGAILDYSKIAPGLVIGSCNCIRLQQIEKPKKIFNDAIPPEPLEDEGGIIFGKSTGKKDVSRRYKSSSATKQGMYSQPNTTFTTPEDTSSSQAQTTATALCSEATSQSFSSCRDKENCSPVQGLKRPGEGSEISRLPSHRDKVQRPLPLHERKNDNRQ
ncbi:hypothetical protein RRF57_005610 [Xylaria bambusicola]|uniref:Uncharacterized protein n=1 Tax=Xylaria bambusicola TaxID=326684 RepID=A0AAN7UCX5_9PEZI